MNPANPVKFITPLLGIETCRAVIGRDEDFVMSLIESGGLKFAFNLACPGAKRRLPRVLSLSVLDYVNGTDSQPPDVDGVLRYVLPGTNEIVRASWLGHRFSCGSTHVNGLIAARCLVEIPDANRLPRSTRQVTRASAVKFLKLRRLP